MSLLDVDRVSFSYSVEGRKVPVLKDISFSVEPGEFIAIQGPSGSGKSTLFYILGCLLRAQHGKLVLEGQDMTQLSSSDLALTRNRKIGFIFQQFHLLPRASVLENILLPTRYPCEVNSETQAVRDKAVALAERVGLTRHLRYFPNQLSGGQQQRVAIARALMNDVQLILADEPTGNLDSTNAQEIMSVLKELNKQGKTVILITHDSEIAGQCGKIFQIRDGEISVPPGNARLGSGGRNGERTKKRPRYLFMPGGWKDVWKVVCSVAPLAFSNLKRNKTRSVLTMLGVTIGIAAVISMVTFGQFTKHKILESYESLGVNKVSLRGYPNWKRRAADIVTRDFQFFDWEQDIVPLKSMFPEIKFMTPGYYSWNGSPSYGGRTLDESLVGGVAPEDAVISNREVVAGEGLIPYHIENVSPVCLIGTELVEKLFLNRSPLDQILFVQTGGDRPSYACKVIGVLKARTSTKDWYKPNREIILPYSYFRNVNDWWNSQLHNVYFQVEAGTDIESFTQRVRAYFKHKYGNAGDFSIDSDAILIAQMKKFLTLFTMMLSSVALITLSVGGIGINNMMLVSVNERLKEIGLLKAIGATDQSIRYQFLLESITLCMVAGILGILIGFSGYEFIIFLAAKFVPKLTFEWVLDPAAFIISLISIVAVGIASGITPALKAEKLEVIEALRSE